MKALLDILGDQKVQQIKGPKNIKVSGIAFDSRKAGPATLFIAIPGTKTDGHLFIEQAIQSGATAIVYENPQYDTISGITAVRVKSTAEVLGPMAAAFYDNPSAQLKLIGITGTNGKTTTVTLLHRLFSELKLKSGSFTTICNYIGDRAIEATHTTPDPVQLNHTMRRMVDEGCRYAFMEVSSHALVQHRVKGLAFAGGIFSNITHDHLDYHKTFQEYIHAKKSFFDMLPSGSFALVNSDDRNSSIMVQNTGADVSTYGIHSMAKFKARILESHMDGMLLDMDHNQVWTRLIGEFNAYNMLAVYATACLLGIDREKVLKVISMLTPVKGRFQHIRSDGGITAIVDYAHTPDALQNVLRSILDVRQADARLITVAGAGGDRDKEKRPLMARIAAEMSDMVILTSDNPRSEDPGRIILDMESGLDDVLRKKVLSITDRKEAIKTACMMAAKGDIILVAGKGHENYQEIKGKRYHFDDAEVARDILSANHTKPV